MKRFRPIFIAAAFIAWRGIAPSAAESNPKDCNGIDFDVKRPLVASKVTAKRAYFVKNAGEDASCPAEDAACRDKAYLVQGDVALTGKTLGPYTCVSYQSPRDRKQIWTSGWMLSSALSPIAPNPSPKLRDWIGTWSLHGEITISRGKRGSLAITGLQVYTFPATGDTSNGELGAEARPAGGILAFADDGSIPFDKAEEGDCQVRMQLIGALLLVEDNDMCGGIAISFTGFYRRKR
ncbi:MAG: hypothetical protein ACREC9_00275 [Methylocella sp.]